MICLVHDADDTHVLLARQPTWPVGQFSVLAGFVEVGESLEAWAAGEVLEFTRRFPDAVMVRL